MHAYLWETILSNYILYMLYIFHKVLTSGSEVNCVDQMEGWGSYEFTPSDHDFPLYSI